MRKGCKGYMKKDWKTKLSELAWADEVWKAKGMGAVKRNDWSPMLDNTEEASEKP